MAYIEGVGDEVLFVFAAFFVLLIVVIAWLSTSVHEPRINLIVVDRHRFQQVIQRVRDAGYRITRFNSPGDASAEQVTAEPVVINSEEEGDGFIELDTSATDEGPRDEVSSSGIQDFTQTNTTSKEQVKSKTSPVSPESASTSTNDSSDSLLTENETVGNNSTGINETNSDNSQKSEIESQTEDNYRTESEADSQSTVEKESSQVQGQENKDRLNSKDSSSQFNASTSQIDDVTDSNSTQSRTDTSDLSGSSSQHTEGGQGQRSSQGHTTASDNRETSSTQQGSQLPEGHIRVSIRFLDDRQRTVQTRPQETIGQFKRNHFAREIAQNFVVRLIFNGRELRPDNLTLQAYNIQDRAIIHCVLRETSPHDRPNNNSQNNANIDDEQDLNLGTYIFPLFGFILGLIWYSRFTYGRYFNAISTVALVGITFLYVIVLLASCRGEADDNHNVVQVHEHQD